MLTFADAKRIIKVVEINHGTESKFIDLFIELFTMLEESTAEQVIDLQQKIKDLQFVVADLDQQRKSLEIECDEIHKAYHESVNALQVATHNTMDLAETEKAVKQKGKKCGRPKRNPEDAKVETYESDLNDLNDTFGVHALTKEIFGERNDG